MNKKSLMLAAMAGLVIGTTAFAEKPAKPATAAPATTSPTDSVMCYGVNSCKGAGDCMGKVDTCSGKNECKTDSSCKGHNSCKGKGLKKMTRQECTDQKGTAANS